MGSEYSTSRGEIMNECENQYKRKRSGNKIDERVTHRMRRQINAPKIVDCERDKSGKNEPAPFVLSLFKPHKTQTIQLFERIRDENRKRESILQGRQEFGLLGQRVPPWVSAAATIWQKMRARGLLVPAISERGARPFPRPAPASVHRRPQRQ